jgi:hypothetical protein
MRTLPLAALRCRREVTDRKEVVQVRRSLLLRWCIPSFLPVFPSFTSIHCSVIIFLSFLHSRPSTVLYSSFCACFCIYLIYRSQISTYIRINVYFKYMINVLQSCVCCVDNRSDTTCFVTLKCYIYFYLCGDVRSIYMMRSYRTRSSSLVVYTLARFWTRHSRGRPGEGDRETGRTTLLLSCLVCPCCLYICIVVDR